MAIRVFRGKSDKAIEQVIKALKGYEVEHPKAKISVYRQNPVSIRIRVVDPDFSRLDKPQRHDMFWRCLEKLPEETQGDISMLLLLAPDELKMSFANLEFEDPVPSTL